MASISYQHLPKVARTLILDWVGEPTACRAVSREWRSDSEELLNFYKCVQKLFREMGYKLQFPRIVSLIAESAGLPFETRVARILSCLKASSEWGPQLTHADLSKLRLTDVPSRISTLFPRLTHLNITDNPIVEFPSVVPHLPYLSHFKGSEEAVALYAQWVTAHEKELNFMKIVHQVASQLEWRIPVEDRNFLKNLEKEHYSCTAKALLIHGWLIRNQPILKRIGALVIEGTDITDVSPDFLKYFYRIRMVVLKDLTCLKKAPPLHMFPHLKIDGVVIEGVPESVDKEIEAGHRLMADARRVNQEYEALLKVKRISARLMEEIEEGEPDIFKRAERITERKGAF